MSLELEIALVSLVRKRVSPESLGVGEMWKESEGREKTVEQVPPAIAKHLWPTAYFYGYHKPRMALNGWNKYLSGSNILWHVKIVQNSNSSVHK